MRAIRVHGHRHSGGSWAESTSYGNLVSLTPEDRASNAIDGDTSTAWRTGGFASAEGESIKIHERHPVTTDRIRLIQALGGVRNRFITEVQMSFDDGQPITVPLDQSSREVPGQPFKSARPAPSARQHRDRQDRCGYSAAL